ncbi:Pentapeptide repeat-containing protein [Nakamurella panacisegetis]|uniref:Pentapeptide repeat-containing protein n=1 Tax=Nakamurella panacisegetis TaxID=1090615 RepID=A0A1H0JEB6_9ACTN|nr:pentapeptide repeat-containing protein [Nakamurella panacisegetis]SDO41932.1 Pentapeptide repeat-containing protein [Nakamurella panacisegetis]
MKTTTLPTRVRRRSLGRAAAAISLAAVALCLLGAAPASAAPAPSTPPPGVSSGCTAGSGAQLREHHFSQSELDHHPDLRCADLQSADLTGLSLVQVDLTGADLRQARMSGANLIQATLTGARAAGADLSSAKMGQATLTSADFTGADLSYADLSQVEGAKATFVDADLSHADLTQAQLRGAHLDRANLTGATFTQATLDGVTLAGTHGGVRWDVWIAVAAVALFLIFALRLLVAVGRSGLRGAARAKVLGFGLLGRLILVLGIHVFVAGLYGIVSSATGGPSVALCTGPQCAVGVDLGMWSPFVGVGVALAGLAVCTYGRVTQLVVRPAQPVPYQPY